MDTDIILKCIPIVMIIGGIKIFFNMKRGEESRAEFIVLIIFSIFGIILSINNIIDDKNQDDGFVTTDNPENIQYQLNAIEETFDFSEETQK